MPPVGSPQAHHSRMLHMLACLPLPRIERGPHSHPVGPCPQSPKDCLHPAPTRLEGRGTLRGQPIQGNGVGASGSVGDQHSLGGFGCSVNLPLGSRSADPHSTTVWCGNLLHSSPQPHTAGCFHSSPDGVLATTTKICARGRSGGVHTRPARQSSASSLHADALLNEGCHSSGRL